MFHFSTWLQFLLLSLFFLFSFSFIVSTRYLFSTLSSRFFLFFFPAKFHQTFLLFHEMACVHCLVLFKYFFFLFFSSPAPFVLVFLGVNQVKGISVTDPSANPLTLRFVLYYSLFLSCSRRCFRFESRFEIELSIQLCASTIGSVSVPIHRRVFFVDFSRLLICTQEGIHRIAGFFFNTFRMMGWNGS